MLPRSRTSRGRGGNDNQHGGEKERRESTKGHISFLPSTSAYNNQKQTFFFFFSFRSAHLPFSSITTASDVCFMLFVYHIYYLREIGETRRWKQLQKSSFMELNPSMFGFPTNAGPTCVMFEASFFSGFSQ